MLPRRYFYSLTLTRCEAGSRRETRALVMTPRLPPFGCCGLTVLLVHDVFLHRLIFKLTRIADILSRHGPDAWFRVAPFDLWLSILV